MIIHRPSTTAIGMARGIAKRLYANLPCRIASSRHHEDLSTALAAPNGRHFSSPPPRRRDPPNSESSKRNIVPADNEPWWSLSSLHRRVATILATSLPDSSRIELHQSITETLEGRGPTSHSVNEAIVSARAREAALQHENSGKDKANDGIYTTPSLASQHPTNSEWEEKQTQMEKEIEERALEKARERMEMELKAIQEQLKRKEVEENRRKENERQREMAFERWQQSVKEERQQEEIRGRNIDSNVVETSTVLNGDSATSEKKDDLNSTQQKSIDLQPLDETDQINDDQESQTQSHHPILGPQIAHLSYKRIHLTSATTLASLPVYEKQRAYRHDRAQVMAKDKKKTLWMGIPGVISLMEEEDGRLCILDGQHRVGMMALLEEEQRKLKSKHEQQTVESEHINGDSKIDDLASLDLNNILVEVFPHRPKANHDTVLADQTKQPEQDDKATIFTEINKAEPIKLLDLPGIATKRTRDIIDHAASHFHNTYPAMFSVSQKCRAPHLNLDNLRDALFASEVIKREKIGSGGELVKWIERRNGELKQRYGEGGNVDGRGEEKEKSNKGNVVGKVSESALKKARKHDFYLGLESTWLYK